MEILDRYKKFWQPIPHENSLRFPCQGKGSASTVCLLVWSVLCLLLNVLLLPQKGEAEQVISREYEIKAAYLYHFIKYVSWPQDTFADSDSPFVICILGEDPFGENLGIFSQKMANGRRIVIQHHQGLDMDNIKWQIVFVSQSEKNRVTEIISQFKGKPVLTVSDIKGFAQQGGIIAMVQVGNNVRFYVNQKSAQDNSIRLSSELLKLARKLVQ